jgi:hypothetical protein
MYPRNYHCSEFRNLSESVIDRFIDFHYSQLLGSAIFSYSKSWVSKVVRWAENKKKQSGFIPSHVGSIIEINDKLYVFNQMPPKATVTPLKDYLINCKDIYQLILRNFDFNGIMFCEYIIPDIGKDYPYMSAISSAYHKHSTTECKHCSEEHYRALLKGKAKLSKSINPECTPLELYNLLLEQESESRN